jgi:hypothetical protein
MASEKTNMTSSTERVEHIDAVEVVHTDVTVNVVDRNAIGGDYEQMSDDYFKSIQFIGTVIAVYAGSICACLG